MKNPQVVERTISKHLFVNKSEIEKLFNDCFDLIVYPIEVEQRPLLMLIYLETLIDQQQVNGSLLHHLMANLQRVHADEVEHIKHLLSTKHLAVSPIVSATTYKEISEGLLNGQVALFLDGSDEVLLINFSRSEERAIEKPTTEMSIRGPKDSFNESLLTNMNLIRNRVRSNRLKFIKYEIGETVKSDVVISYIDGVTPEDLLKEIKQRVGRIDVDKVVTSKLIEELIEDTPYTPFPLIQNSERPDTAVGNLLEGRAIIIVEHTPFVLILPTNFWNGFEATSDVYERFIYVSSIRLLRLSLLLIALFLPSIYVALTTFHPKLIPTELLISIASARENVPFPAIIEAIIMELVFEGLREAGLRLPKEIGQAVSIVGAIVIGQAAVEAGIVSAAMVIVVASTGIASFAIPKYNTEIALRLIRFPMLILAGVLGLFGVVVGFLVLMIHLVNLRSFGVAYFKPMAPQIPTDLKDILIKTPKRKNKSRTLFRFERS